MCSLFKLELSPARDASEEISAFLAKLAALVLNFSKCARFLQILILNK